MKKKRITEKQTTSTYTK